MSETSPHPKRSAIPAAKIWLCLLLSAALAVWLLHAPVLSWTARKALEEWCAANGLTFSADKLDVRLDGPVLMEGIRFRSTPGSGHFTSLDLARLEWTWGSAGNFFSENGRAVRKLSATGLVGVWDFSSEAPRQPLPATDALLRWVPQEIALESPALDLLNKDDKLSLRDLAAKLSEAEAGKLDVGAIACQSGSYSKALGPIHGRTAWKYGTLWLAAMEILPGIQIENLSLELLREGGPSLSLNADCFGGGLRADAAFSGDGNALDIAMWASNIPLDQLATMAGVPGQVSGKLAEGRLTYRGEPGRPADAEASLRLVADGFEWNKRGWESLEIGASLIHRRLVVNGFELRQKENLVGFNGEISLAEGWSEITRSPFLLKIHADIREMGALAGLLGGPIGEAGGRMTATGEVSGRAGRVDGFLSAEASGITFRSLPASSLRADAVFRDGEMEMVRCDLFSKSDTASMRGTVSQSPPHQYSAEVNARIADLVTYLSPFHAPGAEQIYGGALDIRWQGDGTLKSHSGAFELKLKDFVSGVTPAGLTGEFAGTYSPNNVYFSTLRMEKDPLRLDSHATFAASGVTLKDVELRAGNNSLLEGSAFVPINVFSIIAGNDWRGAIDSKREAYLRAVTPKELALGPILQLAGQNLPLEGKFRINLEAGGPPARLEAKGEVAARDIVWKQSGIPAAQLRAKFSAGEGKASLDGLLDIKGFQSLQLSAHMPFGLMHSDQGDWRWLNPSGEFEAHMDFPRTDLGVLRPFLPKLQKLTGSLSGRLNLSGTIGSPRTDGWIALKDGGVEFSDDAPPVKNTEATLSFDGTSLVVKNFRGAIGSGPYEISGSVGLNDPKNPAWDLRFSGKDIPLIRSAGVRVLANMDLSATGNNGSGTVRGPVRLTNSRISKRLHVALQLPGAPGATPGFEPPVFHVPDPFGRWTLDINIANETPFLIRGSIADGTIVPDVNLSGPLARPLPTGRISLRDVEAFLPSATMTIRDGRMDFFPDSPWVPILDVRGVARLPEHDVQAFAFGPLSERKLILRSEPPLPQESLVLLLDTGTAGASQTGGLFPQPDCCPVRSQDASFDSISIRMAFPRLLTEGPLERLSLFGGLVPAPIDPGIFHSGATYTWWLQ